jgi:hypothetical protein
MYSADDEGSRHSTAKSAAESDSFEWANPITERSDSPDSHPPHGDRAFPVFERVASETVHTRRRTQSTRDHFAGLSVVR